MIFEFLGFVGIEVGMVLFVGFGVDWCCIVSGGGFRVYL